MMFGCNYEEENVKCTAKRLKTTFSLESKQIRDLTQEVKTLKRISKTFPVCNCSESTIGDVQHRLLEIDKILPSLCCVTEDLSLLQSLCHHGDEMSPDLEKLYPETYSAVLDTMAQYEANCGQKEGLENLINQVHIHLLKAQQKVMLHHSKSVDSGQQENTQPKPSILDRQCSLESAPPYCRVESALPFSKVKSALPYSISLFPELSIETLEIAQKEYHKRRPLQMLAQNEVVPKRTSNAGPIRKMRSPVKVQAQNAVYTPVLKEVHSVNVKVCLSRSLSRVRSPMLNSFLKKEQEHENMTE